MEKSMLYPSRKIGAAAAVLILCAGLVYWELAVGIASDKAFMWDEPIMLALHNLSQPWLDMFFYYITKTGDVLLVLPVLAMFIYLWRRGEKITAVLFVAAVILSPLIGLWLKNLFGRPRQEIFVPLVAEDTYSFPSGHTLTATAAYGLMAVLLWQRGHRILSVLAGIWLLFIALSRIYLGAHYPSDVLASLASGTILIFIFLFIDERLNAYVQKRNDKVKLADSS